MRKHRNVSPLLLAAALAITGLVSPLAARAQDLPSYARPPAGSYDQTIRGRIQSIDGTFRLTVLDERGFVDAVQLHQGTVINPTGLTLAPGMSVTITGYNAGSSFDANEIDAPYTYTGSYPLPAYYGPGWWYPGFGYGYGPAFSLGLVFGNGGYYYVHRPFYGRPFYGSPYFGRPFFGRAFYGRPFYGGPFRGYGWRGGGFRGGGRR
ncbi:MAG: hypothetical protein JWO85_433 [Candidatus Eremiobacteraeota bacterium]|nr:hypothetical protein [Candidatus Eremiobacteraeota bacterium]